MIRAYAACLMMTFTAYGAVFNRGIGGQNSEEGRARFERDVIAAHPAMVLIYFGINDTLNEPKLVPLERYIENLRWMVERAREAGIRPVLCTMHAVKPDALFERHRREAYGEEGPLGKIDRYNAAVRRLAAAMDITLADFARTFDAALLQEDGVHLTAAGYDRLARLMLKVVEATPGDIVCLGDSITFGQGVLGAGTATGETYPGVLAQLLKR